MPALYITRLEDFTRCDSNHILGKLTTGLATEGFDTTKLTAFSWQRQIDDLQKSFRQLIESTAAASHWSVLFEYVLPMVGQRVDAVLLVEDIVFVLEYKGGKATSTARAALRQAQEYAINLVDFHEESRGRTTIPIAVGDFKAPLPFNIHFPSQGAALSASDLPGIIATCHLQLATQRAPIDPHKWNQSRYFPVPTIIQAASAVYASHNIKELAYSRAGNDNLETTQAAIARAIRDAQQRRVKKLLVVTGVPGAGKTLAGLNAVQRASHELDLSVDQASFLSGNGPLVAVLQAALKQSAITSKEHSRSVNSRIREMHRFIRDSFKDTRAPADRMIVFDEAQRAWTAEKVGTRWKAEEFHHYVSEPEMVLEIMGRHDGWSVIIALVGGGQEIHSGEAGLAAWGDAIIRHPEWEVTTSTEAVLGGPSVAGSRLFRDPKIAPGRVTTEVALHLATPKRSYESENTAAWVNALLDGRTNDACSLATQGLAVFVSRDIHLVRSWLTAQVLEGRRAGFVASSGATRLRADGIEAPSFDFMKGVDYVRWFLQPTGDYRSSNQLECAMSEFEMQGLEIDVAGLLWGGDLVFVDGRAVPRKLRGLEWCELAGTGDAQAGADDPHTRVLNRYRVLLTRFRKSMIIFVPAGSAEDPTRARVDFDSV